MDINSVNFIMFFLFTVFLYYISKPKFKNFILLIASFLFYVQSSKKYAVLLLATSIFVYFAGLIISNIKKKNNEKIILSLSVITLVIEIVFFKYMPFLISILEQIIPTHQEMVFTLLQPLGISFFILQSISYLVDIHRKNIDADKNIIDVLLYVSFFPCILSGPIQKGKEFIPQLRKSRKLDAKKVEYGIILMAWGYFQKLIISNRLAIIVNYIFDNYLDHKGFTLLFGAIAFGVQLYIDFSGYSDIAIGMANVFGFSFKKNFDFPYTSHSIAEFWRRWHISLSSWLKEYIYFPLGGNKRGTVRKYFNIMVVFFVSGLWHGTSINFVVWGLLHGAYQVFGNCTYSLRKLIRAKLGINEHAKSYKLFSSIILFILVDFAWIFFKSNGTISALRFIKKMFLFNPIVLFDGTLLGMGLTNYDGYICLIAIFIFVIIHYFRKHNDIWKYLQSESSFVRSIYYLGLFFIVILFGVYGSNASSIPFNYFQF